MYTLRRMLNNNNYQSNVFIGDSYDYVDRETAYDEFEKVFHKYFSKQHVSDIDTRSDDDTRSVCGFVIYGEGSKIQPLYIGQRTYIMTESGQTFSNLTYRI